MDAPTPGRGWFALLTLACLVALSGVPQAAPSTRPPAAVARPSAADLRDLYEAARAGSSDAARLLARRYADLGAHDQALDELEALVDRGPFDRSLLDQITRSLVISRSLRSRLARWRERSPMTTAWRALLAQVSLATGRREEAAALTRALAPEATTPTLLAFVADVASQCMADEDARPFLERLVAAEEARTDTALRPFVELAELQTRCKDPAGAERTLCRFLLARRILDDQPWPATDPAGTGYLEGARRLARCHGEAPGPPPALAGGDGAEDHLRRAVVFHALGRRAEGVAALDAAARALPGGRVFPILTLAATADALGEADTASALVRRALATPVRGPDLERVEALETAPAPLIDKAARLRGRLYLWLARLGLGQGSGLTVVDAAGRALLEDPGLDEALAHLARALTNPLTALPATQALREAAGLSPTVPLLAALADAEGSLGNRAAALEAAERAFEAAPASPRAILSLARAAAAAGAVAAADRALTSALARVSTEAPDEGAPLVVAVARATGLAARARSRLTELALAPSAPPPAPALALALVDLADDDSALADLERRLAPLLGTGTDDAPRTLPWRLALTDVLLRLGRPAQARQAARGLASLADPEAPWFDRLRSLLAATGGSAELARTLSAEGLRRPGAGALPWHRGAARASLDAGDDCQALVHYARALELAPGRTGLEDEFHEAGRTASGFPYFVQGLLEKTSGHVTWYRFLGLHYLRSGHADNAVNFLSLARDARPDDAGRGVLAARARLLAGDDGALDDLLSAEASLGWPFDDDARALERRLLADGRMSDLVRQWAGWVLRGPESLRRRVRHGAAAAGRSAAVAAAVRERAPGAAGSEPALVLALADLDEDAAPGSSFGGLRRSLQGLAAQGSLRGDAPGAAALVARFADSAAAAGQGDEALALLDEALARRPGDLGLRCGVEKLLAARGDDAAVRASLDLSRRHTRPDDPERPDRLRALVARVAASEALPAFGASLGGALPTDPDGALDTSFLRLCTAEAAHDETGAAQARADVVARARAEGRRGLPWLLAVDAWDEAARLLADLSSREAEPAAAALRLHRARLLDERLGRSAEATGELMALVRCRPGTDEAIQAARDLLRRAVGPTLSATAAAEAATALAARAEPPTPVDRALSCRGWLAAGQWRPVLENLTRLPDDGPVALDDDAATILSTLERAVAPDLKGPTSVAWRSAVAAGARSLASTIPPPPVASGARALAERLEADHLRDLTRGSQPESVRRGAALLIEARDEEDAGEDLRALAAAVRLVKLRPAARDLYGNSLAQAARAVAVRCLLALGDGVGARAMVSAIRSDTHRPRLDAPGSALLEAEQALASPPPIRVASSLHASLAPVIRALLDDDPAALRQAVAALAAAPPAGCGPHLEAAAELLASRRPCIEASQAFEAAAASATTTGAVAGLHARAAAIVLDPRFGCLDLARGERLVAQAAEAAGADPDLGREVRRLKGLALVARRRHADALTLFREAGFHFDEGVCWQYLGQVGRALEAFDAYAADAEGRLSDDQRRRVVRAAVASIEAGTPPPRLRSAEVRRIMAQERALRQF